MSGAFSLLPRPRLLRRALAHPRLGSLTAEVAALAVLAGAVALVYWPVVLGVGIYAESDTLTFFYPVFATLHGELRAGELPLWTPYMFGGFPLFAEGQIGALYPPALLAAVLRSPVNGFLALRVFHIGVVVLGTYVFARTVGTSPLGATVGALAFGLGSFVVGQQHHANLLAATVWLPWLLACVELALRVQGWPGHGLVGAAALLFGLQALATHVQPSMLTGALLGAYVLARQGWVAVGELRERGWARGSLAAGLTLADALATLLFVGAVGALIAAAQILPLYELSQQSWRASGWSYQDAIQYSLPPINLVTLIFPFFFRGPDGGQWSLWQIWEGLVYVGVVPLLLAVAAALGVRRWVVTFFVVAAVVSLIVCLGGYAPFGLYEKLWVIPGMNLQRAPARFSLITTFSLAILAAFGADWLARTAGRNGWTRGHQRRMTAFAALVLVGIGIIILHLVIWRAWLTDERPWAMEALSATYLATSHDPLQTLEPLNVARGLEGSLSLANPKTALPLGLLGGFAVLLLVWRELPRLSRLWRGLLVLLVAADLVIFASDFHPLVDVDALGDVGPAGAVLVERAGAWRILTRPEVDAVQPNELLPFKVQEASGYSPLQLERHRWYASSVGTVDNVLLDLWSVRWIVEPSRLAPMPSYRQVSFHPRRPLMVGGVGSPNGRISLDAGGVATTEVRLILASRGSEAIRDGETVAELTVTDASGVKSVYPLRAGRDIADWRPREPGVTVAHRPVEVAATVAVDDEGALKRTLGYTAVALPRRTELARVELRHVHQLGQTLLYGVGLFDAAEGDAEQLTREDRFDRVYRDGDVAIYENGNAYPRAFVVPEAVVVPDGATALGRLQDGPLDPRRQVVIEGQSGIGNGPFAGTAPADATIVAEGTAALDLRADAAGGGFLVLTDPYYPGWHAYVDGAEVPILRADYLFRAVPLGPGSHDVRFVFTPATLDLGAKLSVAGVLIALGGVIVGAVGWLVARILRERRRRRVGPKGEPAASTTQIE